MQLKKCQETPRNSEVTLKAKQGQHQQDRRASLKGKGWYEGGTLQENGLDLLLPFAVFALSLS